MPAQPLMMAAFLILAGIVAALVGMGANLTESMIFGGLVGFGLVSMSGVIRWYGRSKIRC